MKPRQTWLLTLPMQYPSYLNTNRKLPGSGGVEPLVMVESRSALTSIQFSQLDFNGISPETNSNLPMLQTDNFSPCRFLNEAS